jgi:UDP-GlcNAc:undecaprenyl-phosphate GlcNAc-1-phosphate transferase
MTTAIWLVLAFALALGLVLAAVPLVLRIAVLLGLYDAPDDARRIHVLPVPRLGGVAVYLVAVSVTYALLLRTMPRFIDSGPEGADQLRILTGVLIGSALLFVVGLIDDLRGLSAFVKAIAQVAAALIVWYCGLRVDTVALGYGVGVSTGILGFPILILWIVGVTNAVNFVDGLNGLATGISIVGCLTVLCVGALLGNEWVLLPAVVLGASLLGFLPYNFPKGRIFLGDSGSQSTGFLLAVLTVGGAVNRAGAVQVIIPVLALFVPMLDGLLAILRRWLRKVPLTGADARHIHHRLLALGVSPARTATVLWTLAVAMAGLGLLMALTAPFVATSVAILGLVGVSVLVIYGTNLLSYHELAVAGEVIINGPSRARVLISGQIKAMDLSAQLQRAESLAQVSQLVSESASSFGFLGMELTGEELSADRVAEHSLAANWAWKLDYPISVTGDERTQRYVLSIWCSAEQTARPYGAERVAKILGPGLMRWLEQRAAGPQPIPSQPSLSIKRPKRHFVSAG